MSLFPTAMAVFAAAMLAHDIYSSTWRPPSNLAGTYEKRLPGEFAQENAKYTILPLCSPREFQFLPPKPESAGLLKFTSPHRADLYVEGAPRASVKVETKAGCTVVYVNATPLTRSECLI